jgi:hypothetical protein
MAIAEEFLEKTRVARGTPIALVKDNFVLPAICGETTHLPTLLLENGEAVERPASHPSVQVNG